MKTIVISKTICAEATELGQGALVALDRASPPIIKLLQRTFLQDEAALVGDIPYLFTL